MQFERFTITTDDFQYRRARILTKQLLHRFTDQLIVVDPVRLLVYRQRQHRLRPRDLTDNRREQRAQQREAGA